MQILIETRSSTQVVERCNQEMRDQGSYASEMNRRLGGFDAFISYEGL